jgi:signal transduction histidine kinase
LKNRYFYQIFIGILLVCAEALSAPAYGTSLDNDSIAQVYQKENTLLDQIDALEKLGYDFPDSSLSQLRQLLPEINSAGSENAKGAIHQALGRLYYVKGDYASSYEALEQAREIWEKLDNAMGLSAVLNSLGLIYQMREEYDRARRVHRASLKLAEDLGDNYLISKNLFNIAIIEDYTGNYTESIALLDSAEMFLGEAEDIHLSNMITSRRAEVLSNLGDYTNALQAYDAVLNRDPSNWEKAFALSGKAKALLAIENYDAALVSAEESYRIASQSAAFWEMQRSLAIISRVEEIRGHHDKALEAYKLYKQYSDSVFNRDSELRLSGLMLEGERLRNQILEDENRQIQMIIQRKNLVITFIIGGLIVFGVLLVVIIRQNRTEAQLNKELQEKNKLIQDQKNAIEQVNQELVKQNESKNRILSVISHDIRSPMANIIQVLGLVNRQHISEEEQDELMKELEHQVNATSETLNTLLNWAMVQMKTEDTKPEDVLIADYFEKVKMKLAAAAAKKNISILETINPEVRAKVDPHHLEIILRNLLSNAIKFSHEGGQILLALRDEGERVKITMEDQGIGIPKEKAARLFKNFGADISTRGTSNEPGTGLGLTLICHFIQQNKGEIQVESEPGKGTRFIIFLPKATI